MRPIVIALLGQTQAGKTQLAQSLCKLLGEPIKNTKLEPTTELRLYRFNYQNTPFYLLDTPGDENFVGEVLWALKVADLAILVSDSTQPIKYHVKRLFGYAKKEGVPMVVFVNKVDHEKSVWAQNICDLQDELEIIQTPVVYGFEGGSFVDLIERKSFKTEGQKVRYLDTLPSGSEQRISTLRENLMEVSAEGKDEYIEKYLETGELSPEEILDGLKEGMISLKVAPVFIGSSQTGLNLPLFLHYLYQLAPGKDAEPEREASPLGFVFKTLYDPYAGKLSFARLFKGELSPDQAIFLPEGKQEKYTQLFTIKGDSLEQTKVGKAGEIIVLPKVEGLKTGDTFSTKPLSHLLPSPEMPEPMLYLALIPETKADEDKISSAIAKLKEEDPSLVFYRHPETRELLIGGIGQMHLEHAIKVLRDKYGVKVKTKTPTVPYRETIKKPVQAVIYRHKKQTGGRGQFAEVHFHVFPLERGKGFEFVETLSGMNVPRNFVPAVEKGVREAMEKGLLAGYPVVDVKVQFYDGKSHEVDSSDLAFKIAAFHCFKKALEQANPVLLEPYYEYEIYVPDETVGDVVGDLNSRRARVLSIDKEGKATKIRALAPLAEMLEYVISLNGITGGRGYFKSRFSHYEEAPPFVAEKIIAKAKESKKEA